MFKTVTDILNISFKKTKFIYNVIGTFQPEKAFILPGNLHAYPVYRHTLHYTLTRAPETTHPQQKDDKRIGRNLSFQPIQFFGIMNEVHFAPRESHQQ